MTRCKTMPTGGESSEGALFWGAFQMFIIDGKYDSKEEERSNKGP